MFPCINTRKHTHANTLIFVSTYRYMDTKYIYIKERLITLSEDYLFRSERNLAIAMIILSGFAYSKK